MKRQGNVDRKFARGFTLLEILIVVFIIGLTVSTIAISLGESKTDAPAYKEAQAFSLAVDFVSEFADLNGEVLAMFVHPQTDQATGSDQWCYGWKRFRDNQWAELPDETLPEHCIDPAVQWDLLVEGKPFTYDPDLEQQPPVIVFASSGETTPVEMAFMEKGLGDKAQRIELDMMGNFHWKNKEEEEKNDK